jgi:hypothetical protein
VSLRRSHTKEVYSLDFYFPVTKNLSKGHWTLVPAWTEITVEPESSCSICLHFVREGTQKIFVG